MVLEKRPLKSKAYLFPERCPVCDTKTVLKEEEKVPRCPNALCKAQIKEGIAHFASKDAMNIDGLGYRIVEYLFDHKLIRNIADLYKLKAEQLEKLEGFGKKSVSKPAYCD